MTAISLSELATADIAVRRMNLQQRVQLADEIHAYQPQLLASVLVMPTYGVTNVQLDVLINLLLVFYQAMKVSGRAWPVVTEDVQERCLKRVVGRVRFIEGLAPELQTQAVTDALADHPEKQMLALVFGEMKAMLGIKTEAEKMLVLAALNLVECIAETAPELAPRGPDASAWKRGEI